MGIDPQQFRKYIVRPVLQRMGWWSAEAEELMVGIAAVESSLGKYVNQLSNGPAKGIMQIEPATYKDIISYLRNNRPALASLFNDDFANRKLTDASQLRGNLWLSVAATRAYFLRIPEAIPAEQDFSTERRWIEALGEYWKRYYNTVKGAGTVEDFVNNYYKHVKGIPVD